VQCPNKVTGNVTDGLKTDPVSTHTCAAGQIMGGETETLSSEDRNSNSVLPGTEASPPGHTGGYY
jgi:hypothetical protein